MPLSFLDFHYNRISFVTPQKESLLNAFGMTNFVKNLNT